MSTSLLILGIVAVAVGLVVGLQLWLARQARALEGNQAPTVPGVEGDALYFFHSPTCAPCRAMEPAVHALAERDPRVHSIDVTQRLELARAFGVMATPTTISVKGGVVKQVRLGALPAAALEQMLP